MDVVIDNEVVYVGDSVYDLVYGAGTVIQVTGTSFSVVFGLRTVNYTTGGFFNNSPRQRVFWDNPIIGHPTKNGNLWQIIRSMVSSLIIELRRIK